MIDPALREALAEGVLLGVRQDVAQCFVAYRKQCPDLTGTERAEDRLIDIVLAAEHMLKLIEQLKTETTS
ncbi:hypothetical protein QIH96_13125 [Bradyrhizobium japonicum]|uniref:hypothetical protein n=1 Tax=Bradyrhizobium japonicum TaxID=375 RepID=UPI0027154CEE|nr:hypothetical protein [Bradyrhizobium japonicum]WLB66043.1 hypothetical protein QIH96_13125 [Bradyrhizobium japonicum]